MNERDRRDSTRADSPLLVANDAIVIDSTGLSIEESLERMMAVVREKAGNGHRGTETQR
jgi:cytidylate kinase